MRTAEDGNNASLPEKVRDAIGEIGSGGKCSNEKNIYVVWKFLLEIFKSGICDIPNLATQLLGPDTDHLGHDGGEVRVHEPRIEGSGRLLGDEINDADF
jgi:hypothetical protein